MNKPLAIVLALLVAGCGSGAADGTASTAPARVETVEGPFRLVFELPRTRWRTSEPLDGKATLAFTGTRSRPLTVAGGRAIGFELVEGGGQQRIDPGWRDSCVSFPLDASKPIVSGLIKSGGWSDDQPGADFDRRSFADPLFRLPSGQWDITAIASFEDGHCGAAQHTIRATIRVQITG